MDEVGTNQKGSYIVGNVHGYSNRQIQYNLIVEEATKRIIDLTDAGNDPYNNTDTFNVYLRGVRILESLLSGYYDSQYVEQRSHIKNIKPETAFEEVEILDLRLDLCMQLLKRRRFTPLDTRTDQSAYVIVNDIIKRVRDEFDAQVFIWGERGTGKSTVALALSELIAEEMGLTFKPKEHVFFDSLTLREWIHKNKPKPGQPLIWDEAGAGKGMGKRRAMTRESTEFYEVIQVIREMGLVLFYTAPGQKDIDSGTKDMFAAEIETVLLDKIEKINVVKYKVKEGSLFIYKRDVNGNVINRVVIPKASTESIRKYKPMKRKMMEDKVKPSTKEVKASRGPNLKKIKKVVLGSKKKFCSSRGLNWQYIYDEFKDSEGLTQIQAKRMKDEILREE